MRSQTQGVMLPRFFFNCYLSIKSFNISRLMRFREVTTSTYHEMTACITAFLRGFAIYLWLITCCILAVVALN